MDTCFLDWWLTLQLAEVDMWLLWYPAEVLHWLFFKAVLQGNTINCLCPAVISKSCCTKPKHSISVFTSKWNINIFLKKNSICTFCYYSELTEYSIYTSLYLVINSNNIWKYHFLRFFFTFSNPKNVSQETIFWAEVPIGHFKPFFLREDTKVILLNTFEVWHYLKNTEKFQCRSSTKWW